MTTTTNFSYRAHRPTVVARLRERLAALQTELRGSPVRERLAIHRARVARTVAGTVGAIGGLAMMITGVITLATDGHEALAAYVLAGALVALPISYLLAFALAPGVERRNMERLLTKSEDPEMDLAVVEGASAKSVVSVWADRWENASLTMPLMAVALLGPLTLHAILFVAAGDLDGLGGWIAFSSAIVGHAHLVFAGLAVRYVRQLRAGTLPRNPGLHIWGWTTIASAIPGVVLLGVPPILTAVTGLFLVYPMCKWAQVALRRERVALAN